jgi:hypothetical protein
MLRKNKGGEYIDNKLLPQYTNNSNVAYYSLYNIKKNGVPERKNCTSKEMENCTI